MLESDIEEIVSGLDLSPLEGKRVLITGARGFLGKYFVHVLAKATSAKLVTVDNGITSGSHGKIVHSEQVWPDSWNVPHVSVDVCDGLFTHHIRSQSFDYVIHLAGIASPFHYQRWPLETINVATNGLKVVLELARISNARTLFFSSSEIYGNPDIVPTPETYRGNVSCRGARACYDESKRLGETICQVYHEKYSLPVMTVRPFNVYGPGMREDDYRVLPALASAVVHNRPFQVFGGGGQTRTFCYVTDAIRGFLTVLLKGEPGDAYNVGNPYPEITMTDLALRSGHVLGKQINTLITWRPEGYPGDEPQRRCPDVRKLEALGYEAKVTLNEGLGRFFGWALNEYAAKQSV